MSKTLRSYLYQKKEIVIKIPHITFDMDGYRSWNMWQFLGWLIMAAGATLLAILMFAIVSAWSVAIHRHFTQPQVPKNPAQEFVKACVYDNDYVANVGYEKASDWTCKKRGEQ